MNKIRLFLNLICATKLMKYRTIDLAVLQMTEIFYVLLFAIFVKSKNLSPHQLNSKNNGPVLLFNGLYLGIQTVPCRPLQSGMEAES